MDYENLSLHEVSRSFGLYGSFESHSTLCQNSQSAPFEIHGEARFFLVF